MEVELRMQRTMLQQEQQRAAQPHAHQGSKPKPMPKPMPKPNNQNSSSKKKSSASAEDASLVDLASTMDLPDDELLDDMQTGFSLADEDQDGFLTKKELHDLLMDFIPDDAPHEVVKMAINECGFKGNRLHFENAITALQVIMLMLDELD